ncbi:hypothetical protein ACP4OV_022418 [Aristida adscensionis]
MESSPGSQSQLNTVDEEGQQLEKGGRNKGGWITLPFIARTMLGLGLAIQSTINNLAVYLIKEYNVEKINATQIANIVHGSLNLVPVAGAVLSDSFFGCVPVVIAGTAINVLSFVLFTLSAALPSLRPPPTAGHQAASPGQLAVLYAASCLLAVGTGGTRFTVATMGADQFGSTRDQDTFFSWYFVFLYASFIIGETAVVYLQDGVSWALGFGVCLAATVASLVILLLGVRYYRMPAPKGSPYTELARVVVAAVRKARVHVGAPGRVQYYAGDGAVVDSGDDGAPSKMLRFLNRAAMITASDSSKDTSGGRCDNGWRLCTVQQVEDLKALLNVFPVWSSGIFVSVSIALMLAMNVLQALAMDRSLGPRFTIPAGSITVFSLAAFIAASPVLDRAVFPLWHRATGAPPPTPLRRIGLGHVVNIAGMVATALVERRRLGLMPRGHHGGADGVATMSAMRLFIPLGIVGVGEALHFPGNLAFYYQEFPKTLRSTATAMAPLTIALGYYLSTVFVDAVRRLTSWLPGDINHGRLDNIFWAAAVAATVNFGYFLICASRYKNRS